MIDRTKLDAAKKISIFDVAKEALEKIKAGADLYALATMSKKDSKEYREDIEAWCEVLVLVITKAEVLAERDERYTRYFYLENKRQLVKLTDKEAEEFKLLTRWVYGGEENE
jgi:hypothetical protein